MEFPDAFPARPALLYSAIESDEISYFSLLFIAIQAEFSRCAPTRA